MRILGIDPGYGITGFGLIETEGSQSRLLRRAGSLLLRKKLRRHCLRHTVPWYQEVSKCLMCLNPRRMKRRPWLQAGRSLLLSRKETGAKPLTLKSL